MSAATPGQAAYEAYVTFVGLPLSDWPWEADDVNRALWDAVASTVAGNLADAYDAARKHEAALAVQDARPTPEVADLRLAAVRSILLDDTMSAEDARSHAAAAAYDDSPRQPKPAPELAAAMAVLRRVLEWFPTGGTRNEATATRAQLAAAYLDGGLPVPGELRRFL